MLLPGWLRLSTRPSATGSPPIPNTIGVVAVARFAAIAPSLLTASHPVLQQIGHERWITIKVVLRRAELNRHILTLDISGVLETGMKGCDLLSACLYTGNHKSDHRHRRLLRSRGQRPCNYRAAEKPDEFPPPHGIYSLAENHLRESLIRSSSESYAPHCIRVGRAAVIVRLLVDECRQPIVPLPGSIRHLASRD